MLPYRHVLILLALGSAIIGCEQTPDQGEAEELAYFAREAVDALDKTTAAMRARRVSDVRYKLFIDIARDSKTFSGDVGIQFDLSDTERDLTIDFGGGSVGSIEVNGQELTPDYNGYYITLPASSLQSGANVVDIEFEHDGKRLLAIDTAGVRKKKSVEHAIEIFAHSRGNESIRRAHVCVHMFDVREKISQVDKNLAAYCVEHHKPVILVGNKVDLAP